MKQNKHVLNRKYPPASVRGSCGHLPRNEAGYLTIGPFPARFAAEMWGDSGATVTLKASLVRCLDDAPGHPAYHPKNGTTQRARQRAQSEIHNCFWRTRGQRGQRRGLWGKLLMRSWPPHRRLWSELATTVRLERHVSQDVRLIRCSCGAEVSLPLAFTHHYKYK